MALVKQPKQMSDSELEQRIRFHESTAETFRRHNETTMAREFQALADQYAEELGRRHQ